MANYYAYTGVGGIDYGTQFPSGGTVQTSEVVVAQTPLPDSREGYQNGVLITGVISLGVATTSVATVLCRQSTTGTTATTGAVISPAATSTYVWVTGTVGGSLTQTFQWVDQSGTFPIPSYQMTMLFAAGTGTIKKAFVTAQALGE